MIKVPGWFYKDKVFGISYSVEEILHLSRMTSTLSYGELLNLAKDESLDMITREAARGWLNRKRVELHAQKAYVFCEVCNRLQIEGVEHSPCASERRLG